MQIDKEDKTAADLAEVMFETAVLRSGYALEVFLRLSVCQSVLIIFEFFPGFC